MNAHQSIKPPILSAIGDIALAIGQDFLAFVDVVLQILQQAAQHNVDKDNYDMIDYGNDLRDGCLEAYTGIIQGLKGDDKEMNCKCVDFISKFCCIATCFLFCFSCSEKGISSCS